MALPTRHNNLSNKDGDPRRATLDVTCTVKFDQYNGAFPKDAMITWLQSLPDQAKSEFVGTRSGKPHFTASWKEARDVGGA